MLRQLIRLGCLCLVLGPLPARTADLPRLFPADGNTVYPAANLLRSWPAGGPRLLWQVEVGGGRSGVVEVDGRAYTLGQSERQQWAWCLDPKSGQVLWKKSLLAKENHHAGIHGPVSTPVVDDGRVYCVPYDSYQNDLWDPRCPIVCLTADGTEVWREGERFWCTEGSTPLIVEDKLYVSSSGPEHLMAAVDKRTGKLLWGTRLTTDKPKRQFGGGASVTYQEVAGVAQVIGSAWGLAEIYGINARTGAIMWRLPNPAPLKNGLLSTPVAHGNRLLLSGGEGGTGAFFVCLEMIPRDGALQPRAVYAGKQIQANFIHTPAVYQQAVFGFAGSTNGVLQCTNLDDGQVLWEVASEDWARDRQLIIADGLIFALTRHQELVLAEANRAGYKELGRVKLPVELGIFPQQPMLANGHLYIRGDRHVLCYQVGPVAQPKSRGPGDS